MGRGCLFRVAGNVLKLDYGDGHNNSVNVLKNIELYTLARLTLRYIN